MLGVLALCSRGDIKDRLSLVFLRSAKTVFLFFSTSAVSPYRSTFWSADISFHLVESSNTVQKRLKKSRTRPLSYLYRCSVYLKCWIYSKTLIAS